MENRVQEAMDRTRVRMEMFGKGLSEKTRNGRILRLEELKEYGLLLKRFKKSGLNRAERLSRRLLRQERRNLERSLYPNRWVRLAVNLFKLTAAIVRLGTRTALALPRYAKSTVLDEQLRQTGFSREQTKAEQEIRKGLDSFMLPVTRYLSDKERIEYELDISGNGKGFRMDRYTARLEVDGRPDMSKQLLVRMDDEWQPTEKQLYNLFSGKAVSEADGTWKKVDFNDKDAEGNLKVRSFSVPGFSLRDALDGIPGFGSLDIKERDRIYNKLSEGDRVEITTGLNDGNKKIFLEANPQKRGFDVFDAEGRKTTLKKVLGLAEASDNVMQQQKTVNNKIEQEESKVIAMPKRGLKV